MAGGQSLADRRDGGDPELLAWDLGAGETAVLAYALARPGWVPVVDDAAARKCARSFSLRLMGTLSIVIRARQHNLIASASEVIQALLAAGYRIDERLIRTVLRETVQEEWPFSEEAE
jgi:predicted nucleic acid-binding protein